ncbi:MAG TPA: hypothetical protein VHM94_06180, partial [Acidimicrobiia bacterium]|nr:hypothetical protein [Acidimicrobiia bacterium]
MRRPRGRGVGLLTLLIAFALVVAACGGDGGTDTSAAGGTDTTVAGGTDTTAAGGTDTTAAGETDTTAAAGAEGPFTIGVSNTLVGNGWREQMICSIKAESLASGAVDEVVVVNRNGGPTEQIADL